MNNTINHSVLPLIKDRKSIRGFANYEITDSEVNSLFEAARWSFSAINEQPWNYLYATAQDAVSFNKLLSVLAPPNQVWAKKSSMLIVVLARIHYTKNGNENSLRLHDVGAANMLMALQAVELGLQMHPMGGFDKTSLIQTVEIPENYEPVILMAVGKQGDTTDLLPHQIESETNRGNRFIVEEFAKKMSS